MTTQIGEYEASLTANYKAVQARLGKIPPPPRVKVNLPEEMQVAYERLPLSKRIMLEVCDKHGVTPDDILGCCCSNRISAARQEVYYRMKAETTLNAPAIARRLNKNPTSVLRGIRRHQKQLELAA